MQPDDQSYLLEALRKSRWLRDLRADSGEQNQTELSNIQDLRRVKTPTIHDGNRLESQQKCKRMANPELPTYIVFLHSPFILIVVSVDGRLSWIEGGFRGVVGLDPWFPTFFLRIPLLRSRHQPNPPYTVGTGSETRGHERQITCEYFNAVLSCPH